MCHIAGYYTRNSTVNIGQHGCVRIRSNANQKVGSSKVKGSEPEQLLIFLIDAEGSNLRTSDFLSEQELREDLACRGISETEIEPTIERARYHPVGVSTVIRFNTTNVPHSATMPRPLEYLPTSPITLTCPKCHAKAGEDCEGSAGSLPMVHVARIKAAAKLGMGVRKS